MTDINKIIEYFAEDGTIVTEAQILPLENKEHYYTVKFVDSECDVYVSNNGVLILPT